MAHDPEVLRGLLERCRTATGPDRGIDAGVWYALVEKPQPGDKIDRDMMSRWPAYTSLSDDVVELAERSLPTLKAFAPGSPPSSGWKLTFYRGMTPSSVSYGYWEANIRPHGKDGSTEMGRTLPLAILAALLAALLEQGASDVR
jgi:hypothetical protein